ncbi:capsule assembly Wzi family protein [Dysgonomonas capnocytophagoides]|uniref:capsule assembly Wzi family protein n=1 Tax=Dysgonomonas capnocytophagoides TaxID=45254 RepID=UPI00291CA448|nr:capsule assembly Wzi family protein [Dysgonomonas capnocytophagoides]
MRIACVAFLFSVLSITPIVSQTPEKDSDQSLDSTVLLDPVVLDCYMNPNRISINIETLGTFTDGDFAPFWLSNNKFGLGSAENSNQYLRINSFGNHYFYVGGSPLNVTMGADILVSHNMQSDFNFHQLYADLKYRNAVLSVGAKERYSLFKNKLLSSGGMTLSNNARPIPQVEVSIPDFVTVPYTKRYLQFIGGLSYGWFGDDKFKKRNAADGYYAEKVLYHRKYGFLKFEKVPAWSFIVGAEMDTQWGGRFYHAGEYWDKGSAKLSDFFKVLIPMKGGAESNLTDRQNIVGNVYGSTHFIVEHKRKEFSIKAYHEHFFEDHSGIIFKNIPDGLYGLELNLNKKGWFTSVLFEYLHTKDQSGPFLWDENEEIPVQVSGGDNYYNHVDYASLSNYGFVLGNPFLTSPIYNRGQSLTVFNNRLSTFHGGISGYILPSLQYRALVSYSRSWGTDRIPSRNIRNQFSSMLETVYIDPRLSGWKFSAAFAFDRSGMVGDNTGVQLKISKCFEVQ